MVTAIAVSRVSDQSRPSRNFARNDNKRFDERHLRQAEQHVAFRAALVVVARQRYTDLIVSFLLARDVSVQSHVS